MAIRYNRSTNQNIYRAVRNFNAKLKRLNQRGIALDTTRISTKQLKSEVNSRRELNLYLKELRAFSKRHSEDLTPKGITNYQQSVRKIQRSRAIASLRQTVKFYQNRVPTSLGKKQSRTLSEMRSAFLVNLEKSLEALESKKFTKDISSADEKFLMSMIYRELHRQERNQQFYDNFLSILFLYGDMCGVDSYKLKKIEEMLSKIKADKFVQMYNTEASIKHIIELYSQLHTVASNSAKNENVKEGKQEFERLYSNLQNIFEDYMD